MKDSDELIKVPPAQLPFLEVLWASELPLAPIDILERVNALREPPLKPIDENTVKVTLSKMRADALVSVYRLNSAGKYAVVTGKALEDALKTRDGKTRYGAAIQQEDVKSHRRKGTDRDMQKKWDDHAEYIRSLVAKPVLIEPFSLQEVYVEPLAYTIREEREPKPGEQRKQIREVVDLMPTLMEWVEQAEDNVEFATLILSGDAGCGKSSFAQMFAKRLCTPAEGGKKYCVLYVPLQHLPPTMVPRVALSHVANLHGYPADVLNPLGPTEDKIVLILDGLDELAKQGESGERAAQTFAKGIGDAVKDCNNKGRQLRVLLCGRPIAAHDASLSFQDPRQTYFLIPFLPPEPSETITYTDIDIKKHDQRQTWWGKYSTAYNAKVLAGEPHEPPTIPEPLLDKKLSEFTAQPLLLLLLAITYRGHNVFVDPAKIGNQTLPPNPFRKLVKNNREFVALPERMADLYAYLIGQIYYRDMTRKGYGNQSDGKPPISFRDFRDLLGTLGLAAWQTGSTRVATVDAVEALCKTLGLDETLKTYKDVYRVDTVSLFVAFYFKHVNRLQDGKETFEFTVKPFAEALAAIGLASAISDMVDRYGKKPDGRRSKTWTAKILLREWLDIAGPGELTPEMHQNLFDEIGRRVQQGEEPELGKKGREVLAKLFTAIQPCTVTKAEFEKSPHPLLVDAKKEDIVFPVLVGSFPAEELEDLTHVQRIQ